jgi:hypothetical protein
MLLKIAILIHSACRSVLNQTVKVGGQRVRFYSLSEPQGNLDQNNLMLQT